MSSAVAQSTETSRPLGADSATSTVANAVSPVWPSGTNTGSPTATVGGASLSTMVPTPSPSAMSAPDASVSSRKKVSSSSSIASLTTVTATVRVSFLPANRIVPVLRTKSAGLVAVSACVSKVILDLAFALCVTVNTAVTVPPVPSPTLTSETETDGRTARTPVWAAAGAPAAIEGTMAVAPITRIARPRASRERFEGDMPSSCGMGWALRIATRVRRNEHPRP